MNASAVIHVHFFTRLKKKAVIVLAAPRDWPNIRNIICFSVVLGTDIKNPFIALESPCTTSMKVYTYIKKKYKILSQIKINNYLI